MPKNGYNTTQAFRLTTHSYNTDDKLAKLNLKPKRRRAQSL
jgi:hypothetical protein